MVRPRVTVVVPALNAGDYLDECLRSVQAQSFADFVCTVYDDGSQDDTRGIAARYAEADNRFALSVNGHLGTPGRVSQAYSEIGSEFFCQVDADDRITPDCLARAIQTLDGCPQHIGVVYSDYQQIHADGSLKEDDPNFEKRCKRVFSLRRMQREGLCAFQFRLIRTDAYRRTSGVNPEIPTGEDFDLVIKLAETCQFVHVPEKLYEYRQHGAQTCRRNGAILEHTCKGLMAESLDRTSHPEMAIVVPYDGAEDLPAVRGWCDQITSKPVTLAIVYTESGPDLLECQEYSHQRVELIPRRDGVDHRKQISQMLRGTHTVLLEEALVPTQGAAEDLMQGREIRVIDLEPRSSWLLQAGRLQSSSIEPLGRDCGEVFNSGECGESLLLRLSREEVYCG